MSKNLQNGVKGDFDCFKEIDSIDEFDFKNIDLSRGETPHDINEKCLKLCKDYLSGNWSQQTVDTIEVRRITGGLTNQLYYCGLLKKSESTDVPQEVAIRFYGAKYFDPAQNDGNERTSDIIISLIISEKHLGPKVYGVFEDGLILQYVQHRQFKKEDQGNLDLVVKIFKSLARIHCLDVPIKKCGDWTLEFILRDYHQGFETFPINQLLDEYNCETLKKYDLMTEINWIKGVVERVNSPVVFTHNDFRSSNLLITEPIEEIVICDFDISSYSHRGYDFIALMREWGQDQLEFKSIEGLPLKDSVLKPMIEIYVEECERIYGKSYSKNPINSVDHIIKETKVFLLVYLLFGVTFFFKNDESDGGFPLTTKISMEFAELNYKNYITMKEILKDHNIVDKYD